MVDTDKTAVRCFHESQQSESQLVVVMHLCNMDGVLFRC